MKSLPPLPQLTDEQLQHVLANSFRDFHAKGFDYICLKRTPELTHKFYFFEGEVAQAPEVVHPHDHRYAFLTQVLAGKSWNYVYQYDEAGEPMEEFEYRTPLNGGNGFTWAKSVRLKQTGSAEFEPGNSYFLLAEHLHTIRVTPGTILHLAQFADDVPAGTPTKCFSKEREPINLSGLYRRFTADEALKRLEQIRSLEIR